MDLVHPIRYEHLGRLVSIDQPGQNNLRVRPRVDAGDIELRIEHTL